MSKVFTFIYGALLVVGCSTQPNNFKTYLAQIKDVRTPIKFSTIGYTEKRIENNPDQKLFEKYKYVFANEVFGKLFEDESMVGIIYTVNGDVRTPVLLTYDKQGNKIDSLNLFEKASGYNLEKETLVSVTIYPDRTMLEIDSTTTWTLNKTGQDRIAESDTLMLNSISYQVNRHGKIIKEATFD